MLLKIHFPHKIFYATTSQNAHRIMNEADVDPEIAYPCARPARPKWPKLACSSHQAQQRSVHLQIRRSIVKQLVRHIGLGRTEITEVQTEHVQEGPLIKLQYQYQKTSSG
jgi:hypothetical protein